MNTNSIAVIATLGLMAAAILVLAWMWGRQKARVDHYRTEAAVAIAEKAWQDHLIDDLEETVMRAEDTQEKTNKALELMVRSQSVLVEEHEKRAHKNAEARRKRASKEA